MASYWCTISGGVVTDGLFAAQQNGGQSYVADSNAAVQAWLAGNTTKSTVVNPTVTPITAGVVPKYLANLQFSYGSSTTIDIAPGTCRDSTDTVFLTISTTSTAIIDGSSPGTIGGDDSFQGPGTVSTSTSTPTITGVSTTFFTSFGTRALTVGTSITSSGTTVTGVGTLFLSQCALNDLIGNPTSGYYAITAIASNTSMTIYGTPGTAFSGSTFNIIEQPTIKCGTGGSTFNASVVEITSNTSLGIAADSGSTLSSVTYTIGAMGPTNSYFKYVWIGSGSSGTGTWGSTQRTTPFGVSGYNTYYRYLGAVFTPGATIVPFWQTVSGNMRKMYYAFQDNSHGCRFVSSGVQVGSWTGISASTVAPPTAVLLYINFLVLGAISQTYVRPRNIISGGTTTAGFNVYSPATSGASVMAELPCDGAQGIEWVCSSGSTANDFTLIGWTEII